MITCPQCDSSIFHPRVMVDPDADDSAKITQRLRDPAQVTEEETVRANQILHDAESDFASYEAEIAQLEATISVLKHKRKCLQDYVAKHRSLLAPIRRLPPEVLSLIFLTYCRQYPNTLFLGPKPRYWETSIIHRLSSITLGCVSIGWRRVTLESPRLWSYLDFSIKDDPKNQRNIADFQHLLSFYLKRSLQIPLIMHLRMDHLFCPDGDSRAALGEILRPVYRRCGSLAIDCSSSSQLPVPTPSITPIPDLPCLEYLRLPASNLMEHWSPALPIYQAPRLRHLEITSVWESIMPPHRRRDFSFPVFQQFPWAQITTFELSKLHVLDLWKFLERCNHLSELTVREVKCSSSDLSSNLHRYSIRIFSRARLWAYCPFLKVDCSRFEAFDCSRFEAFDCSRFEAFDCLC
ncbi:hypothetical protein K435DRAFT_202202 [Dendrothele bispora CBS 962.96]|uniref:F-box domain-containing protein n=1 Tax=Dendrothele bispora (strain CBS 962.96) TaxID=1314807 RepID=A0A4S8MPY0_DENBC|nr:hypothetical protein K435DRAFT_202202 [Dendrothele bispora CBS 962.96]